MTANNNFLTRDILLGSRRKRRYKVVTIPDEFPELAGKRVRLRSLTARERAEYEESFNNKKTGDRISAETLNAREKILVISVVDANDNLMLTPADIEALNEIDIGIVSLLSEEAFSLSRVEPKDIETLAGNSAETTKPDST